ncbi:polyphosphate kinase 1 [Terriglobus aquaticus]|uniref:Polyphosphate kinase n=1 Tax=Terriglobus aquaticus TaxID=940139 RepID=A0ABW9KKC5_9BACT|nr:polyphosphate kinase 1 [Terriglobus aquaticus]
MARRKAQPAKQDPGPEHRFFNRDESWLRFNARVLEEAADPTNPLLERVKFLSITASNLDEFVEVRVASILQRIEDGFTVPAEMDDDGLSEQARLDALADQLHRFVHAQYDCWTRDLLPALAAQKIEVLGWQDLDAPSQEAAETYYRNEVDPLLTPVTIDPSHPFPRVLNKALCLALLLRRKRGKANSLGVITVPRSLNRMVPLPGPAGAVRFVPLHEVIEAHAPRLFPGYQILSCSPFRVTRNSNLYLQEEESRSLLESVREELHNRRKGDVVRLEIESGADEALLEDLRMNFDLDRWQIFRTDGQVNLTRIADLYSAVDRPDLKFPKFQPREFAFSRDSSGAPLNIFETLRGHDILLHHPFDSYSTVEKFMEAAAHDPQVVSIKQTLYRTSSNSPLFHALLEAAPTTDVTVVVELMARFDEDSNIRWARSLEDAGVQVYHGLIGHKTHAKLALLVRRDPDGAIRRYAHLGTGNYNSVTARFYTDISFLTANPAITAAVSRVFNYLTAQAEQQSYRPLLVSPITLARDLLDLIAREAEHARNGRPARIIAKMNALLDGKTVTALYEASQAGVEIDLIVRGMCSLRPGVRGLSERIRVRSIVGRFLEHSRIFFFANGSDVAVGSPGDTSEVFCGSADWMPRNLYDRCEAVFPVVASALRSRLRNEILETYLQDSVKARLLQPSGEYIRVPRQQPAIEAQARFMALVTDPNAAQPLAPTAETASAGKAEQATSPSKPRTPRRRVKTQ